MSNPSTHATPPLNVRAAVLGQIPLLRWALGFGLVTSLLVLAPTLFMLEVYDRVLNSRSLVTLAMLLLLAVWVYLVMELLEVVRGEMLARAAQRVDATLRNPLFEAAMAGTLERGARSGGLQMFQDLRTVCDFVPSPAVGAAMDLPATLVFLLLLFWISPLLGVCALVGMVVQAGIAWRTEQAIMPALQAANRSALEAQAHASQSLRAAATAQALGMRAGLRKRWLALQHRMLMQQAVASDSNGLTSAASRMLLTLQGSLILGASCWLMLKGAFDGSGGMMIVASTLGGRILAPLAQLVGQWRSVVEARDSVQRLDAVLATVPPSTPNMPLPAPQGRLTVEQVVASPLGSPTLALRNVAFAVQPGEVVVCIGPSASGKSTLARVLVGVWPVRAGSVRLGGADVYAWNKEELGPHVGYLAQSVELFDGTLAENIARFGSVDPQLVQAAAQRVGLGSWVQALPEGFDTRIGEGGAFLSGGMRQRVALARALYGNPHLVVLDEPNASLDESGDAALTAALQGLKAAGAVVVVMSHRTSVLPVADKLLMLRDGAVAHFGPRDEVLAAMQKAAAQAAAGAAVQQPGAAVAAGDAVLPALKARPA